MFRYPPYGKSSVFFFSSVFKYPTEFAVYDQRCNFVSLYKSVHVYVSALCNSVTECGCDMFGATGNSGLICGVCTLLGLKRTFSCQRLLTLSSSRDFMLSWMQAAVLALVFREWEREGGRVCVCVFASVLACVAICQHMFDRWQKKRAGLIALIQEDAQEARWGK